MSLAWEMATQMAAPMITDATIVWESLIPLAIRVRMVTAIRVIPERGDQFVRPTHSETMTPAIQIQRTPSSAIIIAVPTVISETESRPTTMSRSEPTPTPR